MELTGRNISFKYSSSSRQILKDVDITVDNKKVLGLFGDSGSGKSSLCKILAGHVKRYEGEVRIDGSEIPKGFDPVQLIYQHPEKVMNPKWKMHEVLEESWEVPDDLLDDFGIQKSWLNRWPAELSGGEQQRVGIARAIVNGPPLLIADEPTGNLDPQNSMEIMQILDQINQRGITVIVSTHDNNMVDYFRKRVIKLDHGEIVKDMQAGTYE